MELPERHDAQSWPGRTVVDREVEPLGVCVGVFADVATGATEWLEVEITGHGKALVPALDATDVDGQVWVQFTRDAVVHAPRLDSGQALTTADNVALYRHYDVPYSSAVSDTVLPAGVHLPDTDQPVAPDLPAAADQPVDVPAAELGRTPDSPDVVHPPQMDLPLATAAPAPSGLDRMKPAPTARPAQSPPPEVTVSPADVAPRPPAPQPQVTAATATSAGPPAPPGATHPSPTEPTVAESGNTDPAASVPDADADATGAGRTVGGPTLPASARPSTEGFDVGVVAAQPAVVPDVVEPGVVGQWPLSTPAPVVTDAADDRDAADDMDAADDRDVADERDAATAAASRAQGVGVTPPAQPETSQPALPKRAALVAPENAVEPDRFAPAGALDAVTPLLVIAGVAVAAAAALRARDLRVLRSRTPAARAAQLAGQVLRRSSPAGRRVGHAARLVPSRASRVGQQLTAAAGQAAGGLQQAAAAVGTGKASATGRRRQLGASVVHLLAGAVFGLGRGAARPVAAIRSRLTRRGRRAQRSASRAALRLGAGGATAAGYVLGARAGHQRYQQIDRQLTALVNSPTARAAGRAVRDRERRGQALAVLADRTSRLRAQLPSSSGRSRR